MEMRTTGKSAHSTLVTSDKADHLHFRLDLLSTISGAAHDFKLLLDYLPAYLPQFSRFRNIMMGVSLGGHTAWQMPALAPSQLEALAIVVGCPNLTSLLVERLGIDASSLGAKADHLHTVRYDDLQTVMTEQQKRRWPRALADLAREADRKVEDEFPDVPMMLCNGQYDTLVPARYIASWVERRRKRQGNAGVKDTELFVQENTGHSCTKEMVAKIADWLGDMYTL